jgi:hypothetical protein
MLFKQVEPGSQTEQPPPSSFLLLSPEQMNGFRFITISVAPQPVFSCAIPALFENAFSWNYYVFFIYKSTFLKFLYKKFVFPINVFQPKVRELLRWVQLVIELVFQIGSCFYWLRR